MKVLEYSITISEQSILDPFLFKLYLEQFQIVFILFYFILDITNYIPNSLITIFADLQIKYQAIYLKFTNHHVLQIYKEYIYQGMKGFTLRNEKKKSLV